MTPIFVVDPIWHCKVEFYYYFVLFLECICLEVGTLKGNELAVHKMPMVYKYMTTSPLTSISLNSHCMASDLKNSSPVMITF